MEAPLLKDLINLGAEVTWLSSNTFSTQDNAITTGIMVEATIPIGDTSEATPDLLPLHVASLSLGKFNLRSGGTGGQVEQVAAKQVWPSLPGPHPSISEVVEDQATVEAPR